jgi:osmotically-inducible protein OsmY
MNTVKKYLTWLILAIGLGATAACAPTAERRATGEFVDDAALTARVKTALLKAEDVPAAAINVNTYRGEVILSGFVKEEGAIQRAVAAARKVDGVRVVRNELRVGAAATGGTR